MIQPHRTYSSGNQYRYGFNGKEKGINDGVEYYDLGDRYYDPRIGKMLSIDPRAMEYPWQTSYAYHRNNPIWIVDFLGGGDPPVEPSRKSVKVKGSDNLWKIAKQQLGSKAKNNDIVAFINEITCINNLKSQSLNVEQTLFLETEGQFKMRYEKYQQEKQGYDRGLFEEFPKPAHNPQYAYDPHPVEYMDKQMNFTRSANTLAALLDCSFTGVDVAIINGRPLVALSNQIGDGAHYGDGFYQNLANQLKASGKQYFTGQMTVGYGPVDQWEAAKKLGTWVMRGAQAKYWVSYNANGTVKVEIRSYDAFNVTPETYKQGRYNGIAGVLDPLHKMAGGNSYMQTRATWERTVK